MVEHETPTGQFPEIEGQLSQVDSGRPAAVKIFSAVILLVSFFHFLQFILIINHWLVISSLPMTLPPAFLAAEGLAWFIAGLILFRGIWIGVSWARGTGLILSVLFVLENWGIRIWATPRAELAQRWPADLVFTLIGLGLAYLALYHPKSQLYFKGKP